MCGHFCKYLVWTTVGRSGEPLSRRQLRYQCPDCGELFADQVAHVHATPSTPPVDEERLATWFERQDAARRAAEDEYRQRRDEEDARWWETYNAHLGSDAWRQLRRLVFTRARGVCEGCGLAPATQVHHLTYKHVTAEFLWELVAICDDCHERVHE